MIFPTRDRGGVELLARTTEKEGTTPVLDEETIDSQIRTLTSQLTLSRLTKEDIDLIERKIQILQNLKKQNE